MEVLLKLPDELAVQLNACAARRSVPPEDLALAYIEDWLSVEYAELQGRFTRRSIYRDGPIAFDEQAAQTARRIDSEIKKKLSQPRHADSLSDQGT